MIDLRQIILIKLYYIYILSTNSYKDREAKWLLIFLLLIMQHAVVKLRPTLLFLMISLAS